MHFHAIYGLAFRLKHNPCPLQTHKKRHTAITYLFLIGISALFLSCEKLYPKVEIPAYLYIDTIELSTNSNEGASSNNITDAWIFMNDIPLGTFELPAKVPVLAEGAQNIKIWAGIKENGISTTRKMYPFYEYYTESVFLQRNELNPIEPSINYFPGITFEWKENFDMGSTLTKSGSSDTTIQFITIDSVPEMGSQTAAIHLDTDRPFFEFATSSQQFILPKGPPIYLEISYLCTNEFSVSLIKNTLQGTVQLNPLLTITPSNSWNTIYVNLTTLVSQQTDAISFEVYVKGQLNPANSSGYVLLDNLKLIHNG